MTRPLADRVHHLRATGRLDLAPIGGGRTADRWRALFELARHDVSEARLAEAHVDAHQILLEADRAGCAQGTGLWGVWASDQPSHRITATEVDGGRLRLDGTKAFCGGAGIVDHALVTATRADTGAHLLLAVGLEAVGPERIDTSTWATPALADTCTATVDLTGITVAADAVVGPPRWYLDRPGFWAGAIGPAACWAGAAAGLVDHAERHPPADPHGRAHLGALVARRWDLQAVLERAGDQLDEVPTGATEGDDGRRRALVVRHLADVGGAEIVDRFSRALGPRHLAGDPAVATRIAALELYRRQCHAERDLAALGDLTAP